MMKRLYRADVWIIQSSHAILRNEDPVSGFPYLSWRLRKHAAQFLAECDALGGPIKHARLKRVRVTMEEFE